MTGPRAAHIARRLRAYAPELVVASAAVALAWVFAYGVLRRTATFGLPLDDAYIYLTYAKQIGRLEPFSYFHGGGYSAGSTSVLWPFVIAPFWALGARGHDLVWVSFGLCAALYAATCVGAYRLARAIGGVVAGVVAAGFTLAIAPLAWTALAGMEVGFAAALLVSLLLLLVRCPPEGPPSRVLAVWLAATSLSRPEATMIVFGIAGIAVLARLRQRDLRAAAWWLAPLVAPLAWVTANKLLAGNWFPNTGVAKSHFYLPGFDWTYWWDAVTSQSGTMLRTLFWDAASPLVWPRAIAALWVVGAVRVMLWARAQRRWLVGALVVASPFVLMFAVVASSGAWSFHNYRYIAPAFPLLAVTAACALTPPRTSRPWQLGGLVTAGVGVLALWRAALPGMREDLQLYAQTVVDLNTQVVTLGQYIHRTLPAATVMFHDAGAIAYYGDTRVYDMLGLVTNFQAGVANHGPGARFEFLESMPEAQRPTHIAYYPGWMGQAEFFGAQLLGTPLRPAFHRRRLVGDGDMQLFEATWDHAHTAERPLEPAAGWSVVDRLDIADLASERAHRWRGALGRRGYADPTARWSFVHKEVGPRGLLLDGGRTIRGRSETFTLAVDPARPVRLVLRTGGKSAYPWNETLTATNKLAITAGGVTRTLELPAPAGGLAEYTLELPAPGARALTVAVHAARAYHAFHWFALQPD